VAPWRCGIALLLLGLLGVPLALPLLATSGADFRAVWGEAGRLRVLAGNTAALVAGTLLVCLPLGVGAAFLLHRTDLPGRRGLRAAALLALFVPLPLATSAWQAVLGSGGLLPFGAWNAPRPAAFSDAPGGGAWAPWGQGVGSAVFLHALAGLPWVVLLVGQGLRWVERDLEEDALTVARPWRVVLRVTLPRSAAAVGAAALWVALQSATEITVTDVMQVRTFAEEVYTQAVVSGDVGRPVAATLPLTVATALLTVAVAGLWERRLPPGGSRLRPPLTFGLGRWRWPLAVACWAGVAVLAGLPLAALVWRAGLGGPAAAWSAAGLGGQLARTARTDGRLIVGSVVEAAAGGAIAALLGLLACWAALGSRGFRVFVLALLGLAWATPGPVVGLGLAAAIQRLLTLTGSATLARLLWHGPSPLPLLWAHLVRFFPCAVAVLWPVVRLVPRELREAAWAEGARPGRELLRVVAPLTASALACAGLAVAVLALGELSAGKLVSTPGAPSFAEAVFAQMHYGVTPGLAAQCLLLLAVVLAGSLAWLLFTSRRRDP
jgi:iron(III) transport system permease protein